MRIVALLFLFVVTTFLQGCAIPVSGMNTDDCQRIDTLMIDDVKIADDAYMAPTGKVSNGETIDGIKEVGSFFLPGVADLAVEGLSFNAETQRFQTLNKPYFEPAKNNIPDLQALIKDSVTVSFEQNDFFGDKVVESSPFHVELVLNSYGFMYVAKRNDDAVMGFNIVYTLFLKDENNNEVFSYFFIGESTEHHTMRQYANDSTLVMRTTKSALRDAQFKLDEFLNKKAGIKKR